jgi:hypothetical protein
MILASGNGKGNELCYEVRRYILIFHTGTRLFATGAKVCINLN